ncbi:hypothetical protein QUF61_06780 [Candidatus Venteria ishoeyi]|uniref:hypothetical protein n=1 Tax=Candidatus Venteria ishoeyi TaxID=1899563 RepID=UPI0025A610BE|nr:hypothetical protein [Candidatus Venteria ishoeyi]MDM8546182.1 hypothetical protein [Candidatus Venteria ishoeyi]
MKTYQGELLLLIVTDYIKDRLSAYFYWDNQQPFVQAVNIAKEQVFDLENIRQWAEEEHSSSQSESCNTLIFNAY